MQNSDLLDHMQAKSQDKPLSRRDFVQVLTTAVAAGPGLIAAGLTGLTLTRSQRAEAAEAVVAAIGKLPRRPFNTRLKHMQITPMCICQDWNPELIGPGLSLGINFVHKAGYFNQLPPELAKLPRESYFTDITVDTTSPGHNPDDFDSAYNQVVQSLQNNGLKYYDIYRAHFGWHDPASFHTGTSYKVFQRLKREGKVRHFGVSQHPYTPYPDMIPVEVDADILEAMQVWFSYNTPQPIQDAFAGASKNGIGMTAMKVYSMGHQPMSQNPQLMTQLNAQGKVGKACIKHVLDTKRPDGKPIFQTCVSALGNLQVFEENISGATLGHSIAMNVSTELAPA
jgi:predicted aldo/keto reductase-like oxidoreductase